MKSLTRRFLFLSALLCAVALVAAPVPKDKEKEKEAEKARSGQDVDSGSFGVFMNSHRVGTETFSITQTNSGSLITSQFKTVNAPTEAAQSSELEMTPGGEIRRYEWKEISPGKAHALVVPNEEFLLEKWSASQDDKEHEQPYLLSHTTSVLDDYFFIHREVLAWKFFAAACTKDKGQLQCPVKQRIQFGTLNPHQHSSAPIAASFLGREKVAFKGGQPELNKLEFKTESGSWLLWLDDQFKVVKMYVEGDNTEVIRD